MPSPTHQAPEGIQQRVLFKLILFAILMAVVPICTYFISLDRVWNGNTTYAALTAVLAANVVLAGYVFLAFTEGEPEEQKAPSVKDKKSQ